MTELCEPDRITLAEGLTLLQGHLTGDAARTRLRQAFVQRAIRAEPLSSFQYDKAEIDWVTGAVKIPQKREAFVPTFSRSAVEAYFLKMGNITPLSNLRFLRRTVIAAVGVMEGVYKNHAPLTRCFLKWDPELARRCDAGIIQDRFNNLIKFYDENPARYTADGELLQEVIMREAISLLPSCDRRLLAHHAELRDTFLRALDLNGFAIREDALIQALPAELELPQAEDDITRLLTKQRFTTSKGHLDQALAAHGRGDWASANSQLRAFYEGLFDEIALKLDPTSRTLASSENRRARLAALGFLKEGLNEWGSDGKNFVNGLFKRLHPAGSHPGLSDQDDSTFRRHVVLLTAKLFLVRLDNWPNIP
jgi:hypothetical protein